MGVNKIQIGTSASADFEEGTWTFEMQEGFRVTAGEFAIVSIQYIDQLNKVLSTNIILEPSKD